ncbi:MAG: hypothetical protein RRZ64_05885 [Rikenellaceae bacterium]
MKIGDRVKFVNDIGVGIVTKIDGQTAYVDVIDGFEIPTAISELVVVNEEDELEAINRIGLGDEKPGRRGKKAAKVAVAETNKTPATREPSYKKYGRVSLVNDEEDEQEEADEDDVIFDVHDMKEKYLKTLALRREREAEMEKSLKAHQQEKSRTVEASVQQPITTISPKIEDKPKSTPKPKEKEEEEEAKSDMEVIDLHAEEVLSSTEGLASGEIITAQLARYTFTLDTLVSSKKHGKIVFIHGVGKGKLKYEMLKILKSDYKKMEYQDASFKEYGYGAIVVYY